jgi:hypothetical protein
VTPVKTPPRECSFLRNLACCLVILTVPAQLPAQGFGMSKKKIVLHRKLPAAIQLTATTIAIKATARNPTEVQVAQSLTDTLQVELLKHNLNMRIESASPEVTISSTILSYDTPPRQPFTRSEYVSQNGKMVLQPKQYFKITGTLAVAYQVSDRSGKTLDSDNLTAKYSQDFELASNQAQPNDQQKLSSFFNSFKKLGKKDDKNQPEENATPPSPNQLRDNLVRQVVNQIAAHVVTTDEAVEVMLARGKLDEANKLADSNLWSRYLEALEQMPPLPDPADDAYRLYNIGVGYEALAYQAEDRAAAKKFLEQAAINYGKAIDAKQSEKYFLEPQNRIETAVAYYRKLEERAKGTQTAVAQKSGPARSSKGVSSKSGGPLTNASSQERISTTALTNDKVIEMFQSGVDEESIILEIQQAPAVQFDVSPDGLIQLARAGVKGKIPAAMRARVRPKPRAAKP